MVVLDSGRDVLPPYTGVLSQGPLSSTECFAWHFPDVLEVLLSHILQLIDLT